MGDFEEINWSEEKEYEVLGPRLLLGGTEWVRHSCEWIGGLTGTEFTPLPPQFDGFEEVALPDVDEEEEAPKMPTASKSKRRKEIGVQNPDKVTRCGESSLLRNEGPDRSSVAAGHSGMQRPTVFIQGASTSSVSRRIIALGIFTSYL